PRSSTRNSGRRNRSIYRANVYHAPGLEAVQPGVCVQRVGTIQIENKAAVTGLCQCSPLLVLPKLSHLPGLTLILAKVLDDKGAHVRQGEKPLASGVNGEAA